MTKKALIPCAGFGTRMKMLPHQAKELLPDENGSPTIDWSLNICEKNNIEPIIVTRKEKREFNSYLDSKNITYVFDEGKAVGDSLLKTIKYWGDTNIVLLPDTRFEYNNTFFNDIFNCMLLGNNCVFALFNVNDHHKWGILSENTFYEKPKNNFENKFAMAWGVFGFKKSYGEILLSSYNLTSPPLKLDSPGYLFINNFKDISRVYE